MREPRSPSPPYLASTEARMEAKGVIPIPGDINLVFLISDILLK